jgi:hypothetical protein
MKKLITAITALSLAAAVVVGFGPEAQAAKAAAPAAGGGAVTKYLLK